MKTRLALFTLAAFFAMVAAAAAQHLRMDQARELIEKDAAGICNGSPCKAWKTGPCTRRSASRVDCLTTYELNHGSVCTQVSFVTFPDWARQPLLHHKQSHC